LREELAHAANCSPRLRNYFRAWPVDYREAEAIADLPYLPVGVFKANPPLSLVARDQITKTLASSATTGQTPSRVVLDAETSKRMTKGVMAIIRSFIGPARRPYLVVDVPESLMGLAELGARSAAIQGLRPFSSEIVCCLRKDEAGGLELDETRLFEFARRSAASEVLVYGFTHILWQQFVAPLRARGVCLDMPNIQVLHSGGWKRLEAQAVTRAAFAEGVSTVFGCAESRVIDFYGMVENVGVVYPDCEYGNKHVPAFGEVIIRDPLTLAPVNVGEQGLIQICSVLPSSFPGFLVLTDDIGKLIYEDGCACGRRGTAFRFEKRAPKAEVRGCGAVEMAREGIFVAA
jgi:Acyl-protein synthetase, LuxE